MRYAIRSLLAINLLATAGAVVWALIWMKLGGMALYDTNLETFKFTLSEEQGTAIVRRAEGLLQTAVIPLLVTNVMWAALVVVLSYSHNGSAGTREPTPAINQRGGSA